MTKSSIQMTANEALLTNILPSAALRTDLALLIALCTDLMRRNVLENFPTPTKHSEPSTPLLEESLITFHDPGSQDTVEAEDAQRRRQEDLASPQMQGL